MGFGLSPLPRKTVERMRAGNYVDFAELPPAKGKGRSIPQAMEGQVIVMQQRTWSSPAEFIPDYATWSQCFALYVAAVASHQPERLPDLMAYQALIARASKKYRWPSWLVYDQNFWQEAAGN